MQGKISLQKAELVANKIVKQLEPHCARIAVAGSVRRKKRWVNDIDIVLIPRDMWLIHEAIMNLCQPAAPARLSGLKIIRVPIEGVQVDFYMATEDNWSTLLLIRTGSTENNIRLCSLAKKKGWRLAASGDGLFDERGKKVAGDTEESIYEALGVPFQKPEQRG